MFFLFRFGTAATVLFLKHLIVLLVFGLFFVLSADYVTVPSNCFGIAFLSTFSSRAKMRFYIAHTPSMYL